MVRLGAQLPTFGVGAHCADSGDGTNRGTTAPLPTFGVGPHGSEMWFGPGRV